MKNILTSVSELLTSLDIGNFLFEDNYLAVNRNDMCKANPKMFPEDSYDFFVKLINEQFPEYYCSWSGKTDDHLSLTWRYIDKTRT